MGVSGIPDCKLSIWLLVNVLFGIINIGTAFYLAYQIVNPKNEAMVELTTVYERAKYLLCHDCYIAIYICLFIGYIVLLSMGSLWSVTRFFADDDALQVDPCDSLQNIYVQGVTSCGWFFVCAGPAALLFSLCCAKVDGSVINTTTPPPPNNNNSNNNNNPHADVEAPAYAQAQQEPNPFQTPPPPPPPGKEPYKKQQQQQQQEPNWDSNPEPEIVYAQEIPPQQASAPPSSYDNTYTTSGEQAGNTNNNNNNNNNQTSDKKEETGGNIGGAVGKNVAKLFGASDAKQEKLERQGKQAGAAVGKGVSKATNFVKSKLK